MAAAVPWREFVLTWCRVAALSFGGPAGQIAVMHRIIVDEKKWVDESRFLHALNYCMLLPGPEAQQLATYLGWLLHGTRGGLTAGGLFILPGFVAIMALSFVYAIWQQSSLVTALFFGLKAAVIAILCQAVLRIGRRVLKNRVMVGVAVVALVAIALFRVPFPLVLLGAGLAGLAGGRLWPEAFCIVNGHTSPTGTDSPALAMAEQPVESLWRRSLRVSAIFLALWFVPLLVFWLWLGSRSVLVQEGLFFSQAAVVTFGGAYSVLAWVAQHAVEQQGWLQPREMVDGLGLAETTPGPLIMVVQFVGFLGAWRNPAGWPPWLAGVTGATLTVWVTFVPSFWWVFLGAPHVERLRGNRNLAAALSAITAAVVGVMVCLAGWFAVHTLFGEVTEQDWFGIPLQLPVWASFDWRAGLAAVLALVLAFGFRAPLGLLLGLTTLAGAALWWLAPSIP